MDYRLTVLIGICLIISVSAYWHQDPELRSKRDVMETMKHAWDEVVRTMSDASDAVVHLFKPTEKSVVAQVADVFTPTEKGVLDKIADGVKNIGN